MTLTRQFPLPDPDLTPGDYTQIRGLGYPSSHEAPHRRAEVGQNAQPLPASIDRKLVKSIDSNLLITNLQQQL